MMPATTKAGGQCFAMPDTCKVPAPPAPPIPTPFPNMAMVAQAMPLSTKVMIENAQVVFETSKIPMSSGDEAGVAGGVVSGMIKGEVAFRTASSKVFAEGKKVVRLLSTTAHNGSSPNAPSGMQIAPSQAKVLVAL
ncbi:MAG: PAAR-like domain-containing protein [Polyangiales bacterium]